MKVSEAPAAITANPTEIARYTLRQLAERQVAPTPDNYRRLYNEIAGLDDGSGMARDEQLIDLAKGLEAGQPAMSHVSRKVETFARSLDWQDGRTAIAMLVEAVLERNLTPGHGNQGNPDWSRLLLALLRQIEARHSGWTPAQKRETLERMLKSAGGTSSDALHGRLNKLIEAWRTAPLAENLVLAADNPNPLPASPAARDLAGLNIVPPAGPWRELLASMLETMLVGRLDPSHELVIEGGTLATLVRNERDAASLPGLECRLQRYCERIRECLGQEGAIVDGLLRLLQLMVDNVSTLLVDESWIQGNLSVLRSVLTGPASLRMIDQAEQHLVELAGKHSALKSTVLETRRNLKNMMAGFIEQLGALSNDTGDYHESIRVHADRIQATDDLNELSDILAAIMRDTRQIQGNIERSRNELMAARERVEVAELRVQQLESELARTVEKIRQDELTGVLNRRGFEEAFSGELSRAHHGAAPLSIALLDIDNFKQLNDTLGHATGDQALRHLATVVKETLRPTDIVARYGGEEFVILLPGSGLDEAVEVITRLQRALTKRFFLHENERVLITFSAGVALWNTDENRETLLTRSDNALYRAKKSGKNRVVAAP